MSHTDSPSIKPAEPPPTGKKIDVGRTEDGDRVVIFVDGTLSIGGRLIDPETVTNVAWRDDVWLDGVAKGIAGESIRRYRIQLKARTIIVRHITSGIHSWWDVDDAAMRSQEHIESGLWSGRK